MKTKKMNLKKSRNHKMKINKMRPKKKSQRKNQNYKFIKT